MSNHVNIRQGIAGGSARRFTSDEQRQTIEWLASFSCTHFITLATNDLDLRSAQRHLIRGFRGHDRMVELARAWEGRMNRRLLGPRWARTNKSGERLQAFYFLERAYSNPHWHVLARIQEPDPARYMQKIAKLQDHTDEIWTTIIRSGSTDIKQILDEGAANYVAKELPRPVSWDYFIPAGHFDPTG
ncbi:hypothetical protein AFCDBAGC_3811 [Methylobacterium cerastii]|uniref:Transposase n=1 Tax=Methylobacterium cerastii TaxID=932741 RepID=A0ABQ4QL02_9HYPH|nr:hypothetical protein [Methylobacterium cerastii]GJD45933.1 hypothetical protein AFCDBAGC_3811 [Methylobacterium cerastii]